MKKIIIGLVLCISMVSAWVYAQTISTGGTCPSVGMNLGAFCHRTDNNTLYLYTRSGWTQVLTIPTTGILTLLSPILTSPTITDETVTNSTISGSNVSLSSSGGAPTGGNCPTGSTTSTTADDIGNQIKLSGGALGTSVSYVCGNFVLQSGNGDGTGSIFSVFSNNDTLGIVQSLFRVQRDGTVRVGNYLEIIPSDGGAPNFSTAVGTIKPSNYNFMLGIQPDVGKLSAGGATVTIFGCQPNAQGNTCNTAATEPDHIQAFAMGNCCPLNITTPVFRVTGTGITFNGGSDVVTTQFDKTDTTLANVTGLSTTLLASTKYKFRAALHVNPTAAGGEKFAIGGTATATNLIYQVGCTNAATGAVIPFTAARQTTLGGAVGENTSAVTTMFCTIDGFITSNAAGTLTVQFAQNAASGTSSVLVGSTFTVEGVF